MKIFNFISLFFVLILMSGSSFAASCLFTNASNSEDTICAQFDDSYQSEDSLNACEVVSQRYDTGNWEISQLDGSCEDNDYEEEIPPAPTPEKKSSGSSKKSSCSYVDSCDDFGECVDGVQTRECKTMKYCSSYSSIKDAWTESQECEMPAEEPEVLEEGNGDIPASDKGSSDGKANVPVTETSEKEEEPKEEANELAPEEESGNALTGQVTGGLFRNEDGEVRGGLIAGLVMLLGVAVFVLVSTIRKQ